MSEEIFIRMSVDRCQITHKIYRETLNIGATHKESICTTHDRYPSRFSI